MIFSDGQRYEGDFRNNKMEGKGLYNYVDGKVYVGDFFDNKK